MPEADRLCEWCGKPLVRNVGDPTSRVSLYVWDESPARFARRRHCGTECSNAARVKRQRLAASDPKAIVRRFWSLVKKRSGVHAVVKGRWSECWLWTGATRGGNYKYGMFVSTVDGIRHDHGAHRFSYALVHGSIKGEIDHLCKHILCVRPSHLEDVTHETNMSRGVHRAKTHCPQGHEYSPDNTKIEDGRRRCRTCKRQTSLAWYYRNSDSRSRQDRKTKAKILPKHRWRVQV